MGTFAVAGLRAGLHADKGLLCDPMVAVGCPKPPRGCPEGPETMACPEEGVVVLLVEGCLLSCDTPTSLLPLLLDATPVGGVVDPDPLQPGSHGMKPGLLLAVLVG